MVCERLNRTPEQEKESNASSGPQIATLAIEAPPVSQSLSSLSCYTVAAVVAQVEAALAAQQQHLGQATLASEAVSHWDVMDDIIGPLVSRRLR